MWDSKRDIDVKTKLLDSVGEDKSGMIREMHWNMYITICEIDRQSRFNAWDRCSGLVYWDDSEGWDGEHVYNHGWFMSMYMPKPPQYCKVISLQLNKLNKRMCVCVCVYIYTYVYIYSAIHIYTYIAESLSYKAEMNTTL